MKGIEAIFGGILALILICVLFWYFGPRPVPPTVIITPIPDDGSPPLSAEDYLCRCYDEAFALAGKDVGVMSSQYRTGFQTCRAVGGPKGGDAWTAGWNARLSAAPYQAGCRGWLRRTI